MYYNVSQLLRETIGSTRKYLFDEEFSVSEDIRSQAYRGQFALMRTDRGVLATVTLETQTQNNCSRCLKPFVEPLAMEFEEEYFSTVEVSTGKPLPALEETEGAFTIDRNHVLDLREAVRQYYITNTPMKALCQHDCQGLCASCGGNRNQGACTCERVAVDRRWGPLRQLKRSCG
jgi:uncharacterized protein